MLNTCKSNEKPRIESFGRKGEEESGERVSNAWATYLTERDSLGKPGVKPYKTTASHDAGVKTPVP